MKKFITSILMLVFGTSCAHVDRRVILPETVIEPSPKFFDQEKIGIPGINIAGPAENFDSLLLAKRLGASFVRLSPSLWKSSETPNQPKTFLLGINQTYAGLIKEDVSRLRTVLDWASMLELKIILSFMDVPGYLEEDAEKNPLFSSQEYQKNAQQFFYDIALYIGDHPALVAIQPLQKPAPEEVSVLFEDQEKHGDWYEKVRNSPQDLNLFYKAITKSIRRARNQLPIILSAGLYGHPSAFTILEPVRDIDIFYSFNWPLTKDDTVINEEIINATLEPVLSWQKKYNIDDSRIMVSNFDVDPETKHAKVSLQNLHDVFQKHAFLHAVASFPPPELQEALSLKRIVYEKPFRAFLALNPDESSVKNLLLSIKNKNLFEHEWSTIILDNNWQNPTLSDDKLLFAQAQKFPQGLKPIVTHVKNEKFSIGLAITMGTLDSTEKLDGVLGHEKKNAKAFADLGIDYLFLREGFVDDSQEWDPELLYGSLHEWHKELRNTSVAAFADTDLHEPWFLQFVKGSRTSRSIRPKEKQGPIFLSNLVDEFSTVVDAARMASKKFLLNSDRYINLPGYLHLGGRLNEIEEKSLIAMWTIIGAPFIVAANPDAISESTLGYLKHKTLMSIQMDQQEPGRLMVDKDNTLIFRKHLRTGETAFLVVNLAADTVTKKFTLADLNASPRAAITKAFSDTLLPLKNESIEIVLEPHDCEMIVVKGESLSRPPLPPAPATE